MATMSEISTDCKAARRLAMAAAVVVHGLLLLAIRHEMQPRPQQRFAVPTAREVALEVRFIDPVSRSRVVPSEPGQSRSFPSRRSPAPSRKKLTATDASEAAPVSTPEAVTLTHSEAPEVRTTRPTIDATVATPNYVAPKPTDSAGIMQHRDIVGYTTSRFDDAWVPRDENVVSQGLRRAQDAATLRKTVDFGHGVRMHCAVGPLGGGCGLGDAPSKAAAKDGDTRLSMAPAHALAADMPDAPAPRSDAECVSAYRADARVPPGCPSDTPLKAMDAENAERLRRTGQSGSP
jgi:hypothetical protein